MHVNTEHCVGPLRSAAAHLFPHSGLPLVLGPLGRYWGGFFPSCPCVCLCVSETSSPSCFANFASFDTNFGRHNRHSPRMLNTEWPWVWPQRSRSASVCVSLRTLREGELRQFCVYWTKFFLHSNYKTPRERWSTSFFKMADSMAVTAIYWELWCNSADAITCACEYWCNNLMHRNYDAVTFLIQNYDAGTTVWVHCAALLDNCREWLRKKQGAALLFPGYGLPLQRGC